MTPQRPSGWQGAPLHWASVSQKSQHRPVDARHAYGVQLCGVVEIQAPWPSHTLSAVVSPSHALAPKPAPQGVPAARKRQLPAPSQVPS
jgi:hypothetical protein